MATTDSEGAFGVNSCVLLPCGAPDIKVTGSGTGGGFTVNFTGNPTVLWGDDNHYTNSCQNYQLAQETQVVVCPDPTPPTPPYNEGQGSAYWSWNPYTCVWDNAGASPVIIDTKNAGFHFTDPNTSNGYVSFDIKGDGSLAKVSWPQHGSGNAWLALPDGDGNVTSGHQLFGNYTAHADLDIADYPNPNGFNALTWYDQPKNGGDGNLIIDKRDAIWPYLRLWIDEHCYKNPDQACVSLPSELHHPEDFGMTSISLVWDSSEQTDKIGNDFKFWTYLNPDAATTPRNAKGEACCDLHQRSKDGRKAYDVFLKVRQN